MPVLINAFMPTSRCCPLRPGNSALCGKPVVPQQRPAGKWVPKPRITDGKDGGHAIFWLHVPHIPKDISNCHFWPPVIEYVARRKGDAYADNFILREAMRGATIRADVSFTVHQTAGENSIARTMGVPLSGVSMHRAKSGQAG